MSQTPESDGDRPIGWTEIGWDDPETEWPIPDDDWPCPDGYHAESEERVPGETVDEALDTADTWHLHHVGRRRDAVLLTYSDFFERHLAGKLERQTAESEHGFQQQNLKQ